MWRIPLIYSGAVCLRGKAVLPIPVVDLFAGPGGLGEGFIALRIGGRRAFRIVLSIEKDAQAHSTLELRSFFRQFSDGKAPETYYEFLRGELTRESLFGSHPTQATRARSESWHAELGNESDFPAEEINSAIPLRELGNWGSKREL